MYSFESRAWRTILVNVFPKCFLVSLHSDVYCAFCCILIVFTWTPSTRPHNSWSSRQAKQEVPFLPLVLLIPRRWGLGLGGWEGRGSQTPDKKLAIFSPIPILVIFNLNYFANIWKTLSWKCFQIAPGTI